MDKCAQDNNNLQSSRTNAAPTISTTLKNAATDATIPNGTALDLAGQGPASVESLYHAVLAAEQMAYNR